MVATQPSSADLLEVLRSRFGHENFRPGQERLIRDALNGRDALAVLPTGGGKSLIYQLAAQLLPGLTIVVSPLLALMKDQVESLEQRGLEVGVVNSLQSAREAEAHLDNAQRGQTPLLYVTPERFENDEFMADLKKLQVSLLVVDEAHSISEWGHSFRPAYLALGEVAERLGRPTVLALTATASPWIRREITERLRLRTPDLVVTGIDRPNLTFQVIRVEDEREDRRVLRELLDEGRLEGSGIVYTATTAAAADTAAWLREWGIAADAYHGRLKKSERARIQSEFMDGRLQVIAATNAFGMGIDKSEVRFVVHRDIPASIEAYYQEAGRAGRDGEPAQCILIYRPGDLGRAAFLGGGGELTREEVQRARPGLVRQRQGTLAEMAKASTLGRADFLRLVELLESEGFLKRRRGRVLVDDFDPESLPLEREAARRAYDRSRLEMMRAYAETRDCRRAFILSYFGEQLPSQRCDRCDNDIHCAAPTNEVSEGPFTVHERVLHALWGEGVVQRVNGEVMTVLFENVGYKTLSLDLVLEQDLLARV